MSVVVLFEVTAKAHAAEALRELFRSSLSETRRFEGCERVQSYSVQDQPETVVLVECWADIASYERYLAWRAERGDMQRLAELAAAEPRIRYLQALPTD